MENDRKKQTTALGMHKQSHAISKPKPKIRIIHIFAPEIIKTDVENFRELVQRLTGKPDDQDHRRRRQKGCKRNPRRSIVEHQAEKLSHNTNIKPAIMTNGMETNSGFCEKYDDGGEEMVWNHGANSGEWGDFDGFIQQLGEFPYLPLDAAVHMHGGFAESHQLA